MMKSKEILNYFQNHDFTVGNFEQDYLLNDDIINSVYQFIFSQKDDPNIDPYIKGLFYYSIKDYEKAVCYYKLAIDKGDIMAMNNLGYYYYSVKKDYDKMQHYYKMAIDNGNTFAINNLGTYYYKIVKDYDKMKYYYEMAIDKGRVNAMTNLGEYYNNVERDYDKMKFYYEMAIAGGDARAMNNLGYYYDEKEDYEMMKHYYEMAINMGYTTAMNNLGHYYKYLEKDYEKMKCYYKMSIDNGNTGAIDKLKNYYIEKENLNQDQLIDAIEFYIENNLDFLEFFYKLINDPDFVVTQRFIDVLLDINKSDKFKIPNILKFLIKNITTQVDILECHYKFQPGEEGFMEAKKDYISHLI